MKQTIVAVGGLAFAVAACGVSHISEYVPKTRTYTQPVEAKEPAAANDDGSLFREEGPLLTTVTDVRALEVNDVVVVQIIEMAEAERSATTGVDRQGGLDVSLGLGGAAAGAMDQGVRTTMGLQSGNGGRTSRQDNVRFTVAATVKQKFSNGNLFVEGHRVVMVNDEEHHYYISGVARPADIDATNSIRSDRLADAQVELTGKGIVTDAQEPGWLTKFFKWMSLF